MLAARLDQQRGAGIVELPEVVGQEQRDGGVRDVLDRACGEFVTRRDVNQTFDCGRDGFEFFDVRDGLRQMTGRW